MDRSYKIQYQEIEPFLIKLIVCLKKIRINRKEIY